MMFGEDKKTLLLIEILMELRSIRELLRYEFRAKSATLTFVDSQGGKVPATIHVTSNGAQANFQEWTAPNGGGTQVAPIGPVTFASDNPAVATVDSTGKCSAVAPGTTNISGTDAGNSLTASDVLTVIADAAVSATLSLSAL